MKHFRALLLALLSATLLVGYAFADVIAGPIVALSLGVPLLSIALIIIIAVLIIRAVSNAKKRESEAASRSDDMTCRHEDAEAHMQKSKWDNRDPWD